MAAKQSAPAMKQTSITAHLEPPCEAQAAEAKARCPGCRGRAAARREILDGWASADSRRVALTRLGRAFASVDAAGAGRVGRHLFGKLLLRSRDTWGDGDGDDDDPALGDAFAAADRDGDGFVDLQDVVEWLSSCLLYTYPSPRDKRQSRMPSSP